MVKWATEGLRRGDLSVPFQNTIRSLMTVFQISQHDEFSAAVGRQELVSKPHAGHVADPYRDVLGQVLELDAEEFEVLDSIGCRQRPSFLR